MVDDNSRVDDRYGWLHDRSIPRTYAPESFKNICDDFLDPLAEEIEEWPCRLPEDCRDEKATVTHLRDFDLIVEAIGGQFASDFTNDAWTQARVWLMSYGHGLLCTDLEQHAQDILKLAGLARSKCTNSTIAARGFAVNIFIVLGVGRFLKYLRITSQVLRDWLKNYNKIEHRGNDLESFVPNHFQSNILKALNGRALTKQQLANEICAGEGTRLYRNGGIKELIQKGMVKNKSRLGYYRPDKPPLGDD